MMEFLIIPEFSSGLFKILLNIREQSKYKDWYIIDSYDDPVTQENEFDYKGWWGTKSLPEFNRTKDDLCGGTEAVYFSLNTKMDGSKW
ncbi:MAG: hypothetical protein MZV64_40485 [Ignavibacteriales bacterium]|nr:hypothetical protein [Ignavibacteriales bacterium]